MKSFEHDTNLLATEFDFYWKLSPKMQTELIQHLFESFLTNFSSILDGCDSQFINSLAIQLNYNNFDHKEMI